MNDTKHTQGPWYFDMGDSDADIFSDTSMIARTSAFSHPDGYDEEAVANAYLLAASPEMFSSLQSVLATLKRIQASASLPAILSADIEGQIKAIEVTLKAAMP